MLHTETHFGLGDFTPEDWEIYDGKFEELQADVEAWLGRELSSQEVDDLASLYLYHVVGIQK